MTPKGILAAAGLTALLAPVPPVFAEPVPGTDLHSIEIAGTPEGLQTAAGVGGEISSRAELFLDAIERLHFLSGPTAQAEQYAGAVTAFLNAWRRARRRDGTVSIAAVQENSEARDRLEELLEIAGFLLLRDSGRYFVRPDPDRGAATRRETLSAAGFRVAGLDTRMNAGEAVVFEPVSFEIPSPIPAEVWRSVVFEDPEPGERLGFRLLTDRDAAFLYYGLLSMTPETVQFLIENPKLLREFYRRDAVGIAAYGRSLVVEDGRVAAPGGPDAEALWRRVIREPLDKPGDFFKGVLRYDDGAFRFLYDAIASLDAPRQRFALSLWQSERRQRSNFWRLYDVTAAHVTFALGRPWPRGFPEPTLLLSQIRTDDSGRPLGPAWRDFWDEALSGVALPQNPAGDIQGATRSDPVDASRLVERTFRDPQWAAARTAAVLFAQRRFADVAGPDLRHVLTTLRGFPVFGSLVATLDRMGVESPRTYAEAVRHADRLNRVRDPEDARDALSQFQGIMALLDRIRYAESLSAAAASELAASAVALRLHETRGYEGRVAGWVAEELLPALGAAPPEGDPGDPAAAADADSGPRRAERVVLQALAGALEDDGWSRRATTAWEGFSYVADLRGATLGRLVEAREAQPGASLDAALALWTIADTLASGPSTVEEVHRQAELLTSLGNTLPARQGPVPSVIVSHYLGRVRDGLARVRRPADIPEHVPEATERLLRLSDAVLGDVLRALVYTAYLGDPRSGVLDSGDLSGRHDFGLVAGAPDVRLGTVPRATAWRFPAARTVLDRPWYAEGALLGLDLATADLRLQQIVTDRPPEAAPLASYEREGLAASVALFNPFARTASEMEEIAASVAEGRRRTLGLADAPDAASEVAAVADLGGWRRTLLGWVAHREPDQLDDWLSVRELFWLGLREAGADGGGLVGPTAERLGGWGAYAGRLDGCLCLRLAPPAMRWEHWRGRAGSGVGSALAADLTLWVGEGLAARGLPVSLAGPLLEVAMRHLLDRVQMAHVEDWDTVLRYASALSDADFEDYVSSLTGTAFLRPAEGAAPSPQAPLVRSRGVR